MTQINRKFRSLFISDLHLGTPRVMASRLYDLIVNCEYEYLYLLGDIVDTWRFRERCYWSPEQRRIINTLAEISRNGVEVMYITGNHDSDSARIIDPALDYLPVTDTCEHTAADGRSFLITHGDEFDKVGRFSPASAEAGALWWSSVAGVETAVNQLRRARGQTEYGISLGVRKVISDIINYERKFIERALAEARKWGYDGVICGHTHQPALRDYDGTLYANCGDWIVCGSAIVEHRDGRLDLLLPNVERKTRPNAETRLSRA
jgi:UDP-2,3-diacylglucosamine pyrophosphatase LpxH